MVFWRRMKRVRGGEEEGKGSGREREGEKGKLNRSFS